MLGLINKLLTKVANTNYGRDVLGIPKNFPEIIKLRANGYDGLVSDGKELQRYYTFDYIEKRIKNRWFEFSEIYNWLANGLSLNTFIRPNYKPYNLYNYIFQSETTKTCGDGSCLNYRLASWAACHDSTSSNNAYASLSYQRAVSWNENTESPAAPWSIERTFLTFDTSNLGASYTVENVNLNMFVTVSQNEDNDGDNWINVVSASPASNINFVAGDFDQCASISNPTEGATRLSLNNVTSVNIFYALQLNSTGKSWISKTGITKLSVREGHDCLNSAVATDANSGIQMQSADSSMDEAPYLDIWATGQNMTLMKNYW